MLNSKEKFGVKHKIGISGLLFFTIVTASSCKFSGAGLASEAEIATDTAVAQLTDQARQASEAEHAQQLTEEPRLLSVGISRLITVVEDPKDDCMNSTGHSSTACTMDIELAVIALLEDEKQLNQMHAEAQAAGISSIPADLSVLAFPSVVIHLEFEDGADLSAGYVCLDWLWHWAFDGSPEVESSGDVISSCYQPGGDIWVMHPAPEGEINQEVDPSSLRAVLDAHGMTIVQTYDNIYMAEGSQNGDIGVFATDITQSNYDFLSIPYSDLKSRE